MYVQPVKPDQLNELAAFIARLQPDAAHHIAYFGLTASDIAASIAEWDEDWTQQIFLAYDGDQLIGFIGVDLSTETAKAWIYGPLVDHANWHTCADQLYEAIQAQGILQAVKTQELLGDAHNKRLADFAGRHGFNTRFGAASLRLLRNQMSALPQLEPALPLSYDQHDAFAALHNTVFPDTYYSGAELLEQLDDQNQAFVVAEDGALQGYIFARVDNGSDGYIDFLGVREDARGRSIGARLIVTASRWLMTFPEVHETALTVNSDNAAAIRLYQRLGFEHLRTIEAYRKFT